MPFGTHAFDINGAMIYADSFFFSETPGGNTISLYNSSLLAVRPVAEMRIITISDMINTPHLVPAVYFIRILLYKYQSIHKIGNRALDAKRLVINGFLQWCADEGYVQKNICKQVKPIRYEATPREPLTDIEMAFIRRACRSDRDTAIIEMLYSTGCRVSELCRLDKSDVDFQSRAVYLFGKGQKHRTSYMSADAMISLGIYLRDRKDDNAALFIALQRPPRRLTIAGVQWIVRQIGIRSGIGRPLHPHLIRHTMATDALNRGMDITEIQQLLGHEKLETTMIYAKISDESVRQSHRKYVR